MLDTGIQSKYQPTKGNKMNAITIHSFTDDELREALHYFIDNKPAGMSTRVLQATVCSIVSTLANAPESRGWK